MPRPLGSDTGSCTNVAATLWSCFSIVFPLCTMPSYDVGFWVCECVIKCVRPYMHPWTMRFRYRFLHKRRCYFMGLVFQCLSLCTMPSYDVGLWVCKCVIKCARPYMHPCSMPRPWGSDTGSCTNAAATLWVWFFNRLSLCTMPSYDVGLWVCECVIKCVRPYMHPCSMPRPWGSHRHIQVLAQMLLLLCGLVFQSSFPLYYAFLWCWFVSVWVCKCVRVSVIKCVRSYMHPCSMPRPLGSDTGSCTNVAATLWVWFFNVFPCVLCLLTMLVCECVSVRVEHAKTKISSNTDSCANVAAILWVFQSSFPFCMVPSYDAGL